jgi:hypothetical protein
MTRVVVGVLLALSLVTTVAADHHRVGAQCRDGTTSKATGSGACSHHGGVKCWIYNDSTCTKP